MRQDNQIFIELIFGKGLLHSLVEGEGEDGRSQWTSKSFFPPLRSTSSVKGFLIQGYKKKKCPFKLSDGFYASHRSTRRKQRKITFFLLKNRETSASCLHLRRSCYCNDLPLTTSISHWPPWARTTNLAKNLSSKSKLHHIYRTQLSISSYVTKTSLRIRFLHFGYIKRVIVSTDITMYLKFWFN